VSVGEAGFGLGAGEVLIRVAYAGVCATDLALASGPQDTDGPVRVFGTYWPQVSTLWWYIKDAMPHPLTDSLTDDEVYSLVAFVLNANEMEIDGVEVDDEYVLNREKFLKIKMPNRDGFEPNIAGPNGPENVRKYFANAKNFGAQTYDVKNPASRCMHNIAS